MSKLLILGNPAEHISLLTYFLEKKQYAVKALTGALDIFSEIYNYKPICYCLTLFLAVQTEENFAGN